MSMQNWQPIRQAAFVAASALSFSSTLLLRSCHHSNIP